MTTTNVYNDFKAIQTALFVRIQVDQYSPYIGSGYTQEILRFSDHHSPFTINGEVYIPLGRLMNITSSRSEIRASSNTVDITIMGIPDTSIREIVSSNIKSSPVKIYRAFFDSRGTLITDLATPDPNFQNPVGRFSGFVNNYTLQEQYDSITRISSNTIQFQCSSVVDLLSKKVSGRRTNQSSQQRFFPTDVSMNRVSTLEGTTFNFGAPK